VTVDATSRLNDVNLEAVGGLVEAVRNDSAEAQTTWAAHVSWKGGFASESRVRKFSPTASDEPAGLGGGDSAPNPVEQLLSALGNCLSVGYAANASVAGIELEDLRIDLKGDIDLHVFLGLAEGNAGFESITATVTIDSDATAEQLSDLHQKVLASSPVGHTVGNEVPLQVVLA